MNKIKLFEASNNSWLKAGKKYVNEFYGLSGEDLIRRLHYIEK